jgi:hypothetical protein
MRLALIFCEYASPLPDGTFTAVRAGLNMFFAQGPQGLLHGALIVALRHDVLEAGRHQVKLALVDGDGKQVMKPLEMSVELNAQRLQNYLVFQNFQVPLPLGQYQFTGTVDDQALDAYPISVQQVPPRPAAAGAAGGPSPGGPPPGGASPGAPPRGPMIQ